MKKSLAISLAIIIIIAFSAVSFFSFWKSVYVMPVLMYHSLDSNDKENKLSLSPKSFERQMEFLHKYHYNVIRLDKAIPYIEKKELPPPKTVVITFDDGYRNNYEYAYPILKKYNFPATIFVIVDRVGRPGFIGWKEVKEMSDSGVITIGSHTMGHIWLPGTVETRLRKEIFDSKEILEKKLGKKIDQFCYPLGAVDEHVKTIVKEAGYVCAAATNTGKKMANDRYAVKRIKISRTSDSLFVFWFKTSGIFTWMKESRSE